MESIINMLMFLFLGHPVQQNPLFCNTFILKFELMYLPKMHDLWRNAWDNKIISKYSELHNVSIIYAYLWGNSSRDACYCRKTMQRLHHFTSFKLVVCQDLEACETWFSTSNSVCFTVLTKVLRIPTKINRKRSEDQISTISWLKKSNQT